MEQRTPEHGPTVTEENPEGGAFPWVGMAVAVALVWLVAAAAFWLVRSEEGRTFTLCLLGIPAAGSTWVVAKYGARSRFLTTTAPITLLLVLFQAVLLVIYTFHSELGGWIYPTVSTVSLVAAAAIVMGALGLASYMLCPAGEEGSSKLLKRNGLVRSLSRHPFAAVCFFFTAFCLVGSYLAFGLTFHDQGLRSRFHGEKAIDKVPGGETAKTVSFPRAGLHAALLPAIAGEAKDTGARAGIPEATVRQRTWRIRFPRGSTTVKFDDRYQDWDSEGIDTLEGEALRLRAENAVELHGLVEEIRSHGDRARIRVLLVGHADDTPLAETNHDYPSNFELSEARIYQVMAEVVRRLEAKGSGWRQNVEWLLLPFSSEETFLDPMSEYVTSADETRLMVEVAVMPSSRSVPEDLVSPPEGRPFELLDYLYFTLYTITTTGYGDIVPISGFAKFTTSLANLFEVVFMVIFFNVLVSFLREGRGRRHEDGPEAKVPPTSH